MSKINKRKYINRTREKLPDFWKPKFDSLTNFFKYVVYMRWYKTKFLGAINFIKYLTKKRPNISEENRILAIADFSAVGTAIGFFILFQIKLLCEAYLKKINRVDFALVYNPEKPVSHWKDAFLVNRDNFHLHFAELVPLLNVNPKLGSVLVFNSHNEFNRFLERNSKNYILRPSFFDYVNKNKITTGIFVFFKDFYLKYKFLPKLEISNFVSLWTRAFIKKYAKDRYLIAVNLRSNPFLDHARNAAIDAWEQFFTYCFKRYPDVSFVILGRKSEIAENLRNLPNVIYTKDHETDIQHTLGFIEHSLFYMATSSGPATHAILSEDIPYIIVSFRTPEVSYNYNWFKPGIYLPWQNREFQKLIWEKETPQLLIKEFKNLFDKVDKEKWARDLNLNDVDESILEWPYLIKK